MILALDLGTHMGYAIGNHRGKLESGTVDFSFNKRTQGGGMRYLKFVQWLERIDEKYNITEIYYEEVKRHSSTAAGHVYGSFEGHLMSRYDNPEDMTPYQSIPVGTIKKYATDKGNAGKPMMVAAAVKKGWLPEDCDPEIFHDEADALWILDYAINVLGAE